MHCNVILVSMLFVRQHQRHWFLPLVFGLSLGFANGPVVGHAQEQVFSGPQAGEPMVPFSVIGAFDESEGKEMDFVKEAKDQPIVLIFVHDLNRLSISMTRVLSTYTASRKKDGLHTGVVWLDDDKSNANATLKRIRHGLAKDAPVGISVDGREGPGSYGLNRNVMLTILVGKNQKVTANYAIVQPSLQVDLPKILKSVVDVAGGDIPKLETLEGMQEMMKQPATKEGETINLRSWLVPIIRRNAQKEDVEKAALEFEKFLEGNTAAQKEIGRITNTIINAGKLEDYGTATTQEYFRKWAKQYPHEPKR